MTGPLPVLTAVTGARWESALVSGLQQTRPAVTVVRRCVDLADLLAAAATGTARAALLSADLRRLDRDALARLATARVAVVGLVSPGDEPAERRLRQLGVGHVLPADVPPAELGAVLAAAVAALDAQPSRPAYADPVATDPVPRHDGVAPAAAVGARLEPGAGRLVAVWGPTGAPGRTTVAVTLADEMAALGQPVLLADVDSYGGCVAQVLGLLDEAPGLVAAVRQAGTGRLDLPGLARLATEVVPRLRVLTGIHRADRWPELRAAALDPVWALARSLAGVVVADCGFSLEQDEELVFDTAAPRRNGATLVTLAAADLVVVVGSADPVGVHRLVRALDDLRAVVPDADVRVVLNRVRRGPIGPDPERQLAAALDRYAGVRAPWLVPEDRAACDAALAAARTLREAAPDSPARRALAALAAQIVGVPARRPRRRLSWGRRS